MRALVGLPGAQLMVMGAWLLAGVVLAGWGALARSALRAPATTADDWLASFWAGWCAAVLALQVWHLFLPVDPTAAAACTVVGALGLLIGLRHGATWLRRVPRHLVAITAALLLLIWLSNHALEGARYGDVGAYFMPTVRWYEAHPILPGLGNLHGFFALNQSYFLYVAALEVGPFAHRSFHLANGLLVLMLGIRMLLAMERVLRFRRAARPEDLYYALMLPGTLALGVGIFLTSPCPDVVVFALGAVASGELIALTGDDAQHRTGRVRLLVLFAMAGVTAKLSFAGFAIALLLATAWVWWRNERPSWGRAVREFGVAVAVGLAAIGPWIVRNIVMSGFPLFPSAVIVLPVEWRVQTDVEGWLRNSVHPGGAMAMFHDTRWFLQQLLKQQWDAPDVIGPLLVALAGVLVAGVRRLVRRGGDGRLPFVAVLPALASLQYCLMLSPVPRYAGATVWILAATGILLACGDRLRRAGSVLRPVAALAIVVATVFTIRIGMSPFWMPLDDFQLMSVRPFEARRLPSGLVVNVPIIDDACWDIPLPCTAYPNPALRLRREGDPASGFMLDPDLHAQFPYEPGAAWVLPPSPQ